MKSALLGGLALAAVLIPGLATAGPQPVLYYLGDDAASPLRDGGLVALRPVSNQTSTKVVGVGVTEAAPVRFLTNASTHPERMIGPVYLALWTGPSAAVKGNLTATLFIENGTKIDAIANASIALDANASKLPQATAFVPPTPSPGADPQQTLVQTAFYELVQVLPIVTPPPQLVFLGNVDVRVDATARIGVTFAITPGSSPLPTAEGAAASLQYNSTTAPSFLYIPWNVPSAPRTTHATVRLTAMPNSGDATDSFGSPAEAGMPDDSGRGLPGPAAAIGMASLVAVFFVLRRRAR